MAKTELNSASGIIDDLIAEIESLENELKTANETIEKRDDEISGLRVEIAELEAESNAQ